MGSGASPETGASDNPGIRPSRHATLHSHAYFFSLPKPNLEWSRWIRASPFLVYFFFLSLPCQLRNYAASSDPAHFLRNREK